MSAYAKSIAAALLLAFLLFPDAGTAQPVKAAESRELSPALAMLADSIRVMQGTASQGQEQHRESLKVRLALALHPESPNLESIIPGIWPYDWEGMECQLASVTSDTSRDLLALLYHAGEEREVTIMLFEWSTGQPRLHLLNATEQGVQNVLFLLPGADVLDLFSQWSESSSVSFPYLLDIDSDGQSEILRHGTVPGFSGPDGGALYWPHIYSWGGSRLILNDESLAKFYYDTVVKLYSPVLGELDYDWTSSGEDGPHPTAEKIREIIRRVETPSEQNWYPQE
jgi:hypothetical protein